MEELEFAFTKTTYVGDAPAKFEQYLRRCWGLYTPTQVMAPYVALVQSSGFGKSRLIYELALKAKVEEERGSDFNMKILYTCVRFHASTGYPQTTELIRDLLFVHADTTEMLADRLRAIYYYAIEN